MSQVITKCLMQGQSTAIGDGRQKPARQQEMGAADPCNTSRSEGTASRCGSKTKGTWENSERCRSLYLEKAAGGATPAALPEEAAPNLTGSRLGWKQKRAALSPRRRLFLK